jgi:hypothetical protein
MEFAGGKFRRHPTQCGEASELLDQAGDGDKRNCLCRSFSFFFGVHRATYSSRIADARTIPAPMTAPCYPKQINAGIQTN